MSIEELYKHAAELRDQTAALLNRACELKEEFKSMKQHKQTEKKSNHGSRAIRRVQSV
jgi:hypothetical protein